MAVINPHINFNGNAEEAFNFYKSVFGGGFEKIIRFKDIESVRSLVGDNEADKIMKITLPIGKNFLIGNDVPEFMGRVNENENRSKISITAEDPQEGKRLFTGLSADGNIEMPFDENPSGPCFGMFRDKFGIEWTIEFDPKTTA